MRKFIGWDCANKTLAWSYVTIDTDILVKINAQLQVMKAALDVYKATLDGPTACNEGPHNYDDFIAKIQAAVSNMNVTVGNFIQYHSYGVIDVLNGKKVADTSPVDRTRALWQFLSTHPTISSLAPGTVPIIEYQPPKIGTKTNGAASMVSHQLMFYYINSGPILVDPKLKNTISCGPEMTLECFLSAEMPKHKSMKDTRYAARKIHSRENYLYLLNTLGMQHITRGIRKGVLDDLADSTMQIIAYLVTNKMINRAY
jgi:hypothetical protein